MPSKLEVAQRRMLGFILLLFGVGIPIGTAVCILYIFYIESDAKWFHGFIMLAAIGFTAPMFVLSVRLMLKMYYENLEVKETFADLIQIVKNEKVDLQPLIEDGKKTVERVIPVVDRTAEAIDRLTKDGKLEKAVDAIAVIPAKLDELGASSRPAAADVEVPLLPDEGDFEES